jgi:hypothetical protein
LCLSESALSSSASEDGGLVATERSIGLTSLLLSLCCLDLSSAGSSIVFLSYSRISLELSSTISGSSSSLSDSSDTSAIRLLIGLKFFRLLRGLLWMLLVICSWAWASYWESLS